LNANRYDPNSVSNPYGQYGSPYSHLAVGTPPTIFARMCNDHGVRGAMRKLIMSGKVESGIITCVEYGIDKWCVEWAAVYFFPAEFTAEERRWAQIKYDETVKLVGRRRKKPKVAVDDPPYREGGMA